MTLNEQAHVVAMARVFGIDISQEEILKRYKRGHQEVIAQARENSAKNQVEVIRRPW